MARWRLSPNAQILIAILAGVVSTVQEAMYFNLKDSLTEAWRLEIPHVLYSSAFENLLKTIVFAIILIRGVTIHIYLASYLLMVIPVALERMRLVLLIWLAISGLRSIIVNFVAMVVGIFICSSLPRAHPACFNFIGVKGFELGCSAFMWVLVNDFYYYLGQRRTLEQPSLALGMQGIPSLDNWNFRSSGFPLGDLDEDSSSASLYSTITDAINKIKRKQMRYGRIVKDEETDEVVRMAVSRFFENSFGWKYVGYNMTDEDDEELTAFLDLYRDELEALMENLRNYVKNNISKESCIHENCYYCLKERSEKKIKKNKKKKEYERLSRRTEDYPFGYEVDTKTWKRFVKEFRSVEERDDNMEEAIQVHEDLIGLLRDSEKSCSLNTTSLNSSTLDKAGDHPDQDVHVDTQIQTEPLSTGMLRKIKKQEENLFDQKSDSAPTP